MLEDLPSQGLGIVGTREPETSTRDRIQAVLGGLSGSRLQVVSGFARGVDACAHEAALRHGLVTVAVVAAGLDVDYPREHRELRAAILENGGLMISETPLGQRPYESSFLERNRWIAALSRAIWVAEAPVRSGSLNTAAWALRFGRTLFATPCLPGDPRFAGNQRLLECEPALALWGTRSLGAAWLELASAGREAQPELSIGATAPLTGLPADARRLHREAVRREWDAAGASLQDLLAWSMRQGWTAARFFEALAELERSGWARREPGSGALRAAQAGIRSGAERRD